VNYVFNKLNLDAKKYIQLDPSYLRPEELNILKGDSAPIRNELNWEPEYTFETLIDEMLEYYLTLK
jgi:GDPmannose 4,6-dehydratase